MVGKSSMSERSGAHALTRPRVPSYLLPSLAIALGLTAVFYLVVVHIMCRGSYTETMFSQRGFIPYMTTYLTFVGLIQLLALRIHLSRESRNLHTIASELAHQKSIDLDNAGNTCRRIDQQIRGIAGRGLVVNRVRRVLQRVVNKGSTSDVAALLSEQAEIDRAILSNGYATVKFIGWLIPVLGFIGTVSGISLAIANFPALFDQANQAQQDVFAPITRNLGVAFETTLLALIEVAIVLFVLFAVQKRGNELLNIFDEFCLDNLLGKIRGRGIPEEHLPEPYRDLFKLLSGYMEDLEGAFEDAIARVVSRLTENEQARWQALTESFREVAQDHQQTIRATCETLADKSQQLAEELRNWEPQLRECLTDFATEIGKLEAETAREIAARLEATTTVIGRIMAETIRDCSVACEQMTTQQGAMIEELRQLEKQHVAETTQKLSESADRIGKQLTDAAGGWSAAADRMITSQTEAATGLRDAMARIEELLHTSEELRTIQQTLHANLAAVKESKDMVGAMDRLSGCLDRLDPTLQELQRRRRMQVRILEEFDDQNGDSP